MPKSFTKLKQKDAAAGEKLLLSEIYVGINVCVFMTIHQHHISGTSVVYIKFIYTFLDMKMCRKYCLKQTVQHETLLHYTTFMTQF